MTKGNLRWMQWYVGRVAEGATLLLETHDLAQSKIAAALEQKRLAAIKRRETRRRHVAARTRISTPVLE